MAAPGKPENPKHETQESERERKDHLDEALDEALKESFPASDPPAVRISRVTQPGSGRASQGERRPRLQESGARSGPAGSS